MFKVKIGKPATDASPGKDAFLITCQVMSGDDDARQTFSLAAIPNSEENMVYLEEVVRLCEAIKGARLEKSGKYGSRLTFEHVPNYDKWTDQDMDHEDAEIGKKYQSFLTVNKYEGWPSDVMVDIIDARLIKYNVFYFDHNDVKRKVKISMD